jgi:hypothetical protein
VLCPLPHPFGYAAQALPWSYVLPDVTHFSFEGFDPLKEFIDFDGAATGHRKVL